MAEAEASADARSRSNTGPLEDHDGIFSGHSFYVSRTVPSRDYFVGIIMSNGGIVTQTDSTAEFVIVDHLRKGNYHTPVYGYKFLEDCSKNNRLEDIEKYLVEGKGKNSKNATSVKKIESAPRKYARTGRVPFTDEDDQILLNWISQPGAQLGGNKIYQELSDMFPHHSMHSWRGRWRDQLSKTMPDGPKPSRIISFDDYEPPSVEEGGEAEEGGGEEEEEEEEEEGEKSFTREDDSILMEMKDEIIHAANAKTVYRKIHRKHPHHSEIEWRNRFTSVLLPLINKRAVSEPPAAEGEAEDNSPRPSEALPEEQPDPHVPEAAVAAEQQQQPTDGEPPTLPKPLRAAPAAGAAAAATTRAHHNRRASDQVVNYSTKMGQSLSTPKPVKKSRHTLAPGEKISRQPPVGHVSRSTSPEEDDKPHTPTNHDTHLLKPPKSPKGHPRKDLPLSPRVKINLDLSPAQQNVRVQQWRADVSRHTTAEAADNAMEDELQLQLNKEIRDTSPSLPPNAKFRPGSPSSAVQPKRKLDTEPVTPKTSINKRVKIVERAGSGTSSTTGHKNAASNTQFPSTPPVKSSGVRIRSPTISDPDSLKPAPPTSSRVTSAVKMKKSYHEMSTQAIYENIPDGNEDLVNEEIPGLENLNDEMDEDEDDFRPQNLKDEDIFLSKNGDKGTLSFESAPDDMEVINEDEEMEGEEDDDDKSEELDEEAAKQQEAEIEDYLSKKAAEFGVSEKDVIEAIERTSGEKNLVDVVLRAKVRGEGLPRKVPGVWLPEEDQILMDNNARLIMELEKKHGDRVLERMEWLGKWQEA